MKKAVWGALAIALALGVGAPASAEHHEAGEKAWDQAKVSELATTLAKQVGDVRKAHRGAPTPPVASGYSRAHLRFTDDLRLIENESRHLSKQLGDGKTKDDTQPVTSKIDVARDTMNALRAFYGDAPVEAPER